MSTELPPGFTIIDQAQPSVELPPGFTIEQPGEVLSNAQSIIPEKRAITREAKKRGLIQSTPEQLALRQSAVDETIQDIWPTTAFAISVGKGVENVMKGIGLAPEPTEQSVAGMQALEEEFPIASTIGEITGEATPFLLPGGAIGKLATIPARMVAGGALGAAEGGILAEDTAKGAGVGAAIGAGAEILFPVIGRLGRTIWRKVKGKEPVGTLLDNTGQPTPEFQQVLDESGVDFEELTEDATQMISAQAGRDPQQVATAARFKEAGIPITKGELTKETAQRTRENQLFETGQEGSEQLRQFKLKQSEAIKGYLDNAFGADVTASETGELIQGALTGREKMLRTRKNDFYDEFARNTEDLDTIPIIADSIVDTIPNERKLRGLNRASKGSVNNVMDTMAEYGIIEPTEDMVARGLEPEILSLRNFDDFEQTLNDIQRSDISGATGKLVGPIRDALAKELDEMASVLTDAGMAEKITEPLKQARATVQKMKTEFNPKSIVGKLTDFHKNSDVPLVAATQVYSKLAANSMPVENINRVMNSLKKAPDGEAGISALQTSVMMDLLDAGFGTQSRQIEGIQTFNPTAFKKRLKMLGEDKVASIFRDNKEAFRKIRNVDAIASDLIPPATTVPKGSAAVNIQIAQSLGLAAAGAKIPVVGPMMVGAMQKIAQPVKAGMEVRKAINAELDVMKFATILDEHYPNLTRAFGISIKEDE